LETNRELLLKIECIAIETKKVLERLVDTQISCADSQQGFTKEYDKLLERYDIFLDSVSDCKDKEATQKYKKRELWIKIILAGISVFSLWLGQQISHIGG